MSSRAYIKVESSPYIVSPCSSPGPGERNLLFCSQELGSLSPGASCQPSPSGSGQQSPSGSGHLSPRSASPSTRTSSVNCISYFMNTATEYDSFDTQHHRPVSLFINGCSVGVGGGGGGGGGGEHINLGLCPDHLHGGGGGGDGSRSDISSRHSSISTGSRLSTTTTTTTTRLLPPPSASDNNKAPESYLFLALVVAFFFNLPFGLIAMCISLRARKACEQGASQHAERLATTSLCVSLAGIFLSALAIGLAIFFIIHKQ